METRDYREMAPIDTNELGTDFLKYVWHCDFTNLSSNFFTLSTLWRHIIARNNYFFFTFFVKSTDVKIQCERQKKKLHFFRKISGVSFFKYIATRICLNAYLWLAHQIVFSFTKSETTNIHSLFRETEFVYLFSRILIKFSF